MAMTIRLPEELDRALDAIAEAEHVSKHALVLQGVELIVARRARRVDVDDAIDFVLSHDAELLRRLEDA
ncbi:ribbon-helix-helix protein, CopG family [Microbacterium sp. ProA8]|uniref:ribbon-helix-helix protein, CopG family n=1 Tax=Microbacterium chionoecetis TaxID=3153754 RepID=UPI003266499E